MRSLSRKNPSSTLIFFPFSWKYLFFVNNLLIYIKFTLLEQMIRNTMLISLTFFSLNSESYAEDNKVHLKAKTKVMRHHLHIQIRCQYKIILEDKMFKQFLITFTYNA